MASSAGARRRQDSSGDNEISDAAPDALGETSAIEYGTAVFRTSDIAFSGAVKSRDKSPSVYSSDVDCLYDDDLADEPLISALQARVAGIETEQRAQRLAIEGAFLRDPHVDSD